MRKRNRRIAILISLCMIIALIPLSTFSVMAAQRYENPLSRLFTTDTADTEEDPQSSETQPTESDSPSDSPAPSASPEVTETTTPSPSESVKPTPSEEPSKLPFTDVSTKDYFYEPVAWAVEHTVTAGTEPTKFSPNIGCSRAQVMMFLWRANGSPRIILRNNPFKDVKEGDYFYDAVLWAVRNGITTGTSTDTFSPDLNCTRAQVMTFLWRAKNSPDVGRRVMSFTDVKADQYYYDPVCWAVKEGITAGTSDTTFDPDVSCTRAQVVTFLWQAYK